MRLKASCLLVVVSMIAACGGKSSKSDGNSGENAEKPEEVTPKKTKKQTSTNSDAKLGKKTGGSTSSSVSTDSQPFPPGGLPFPMPPLPLPGPAPAPAPTPAPAATFAVVYEGNGSDGGMVPSDATRYPSGAMVSVKGNSGALTKAGFSFAGWNTAADGSGTTYKAESGSFAVGSADVKLYARWLAGNLCGEANDSCYKNQAAMAAGTAVTFTGKMLVLANGIWGEKDGARVLAASGIDEWAFALSADGRKFLTTYLKKADIAGRVCPKNVFVPGNLVATGRCLYYDAGNSAQRLDAPTNDSVTDQMTAGSIRLGAWNAPGGGNAAAASWYEGNIQLCAAKGMRLPTLYETSSNMAGNPIDATPTFSPGEGVPSVTGTYTWTATALYSSNSATSYMLWSGTLSGYQSLAMANSVRCVVP